MRILPCISLTVEPVIHDAPRAIFFDQYGKYLDKPLHLVMIRHRQSPQLL